MRLAEAKKYVAEKLKVTPLDLIDECGMRDVREDLGHAYTNITKMSCYKIVDYVLSRIQPRIKMYNSEDRRFSIHSSGSICPRSV